MKEYHHYQTALGYFILIVILSSILLPVNTVNDLDVKAQSTPTYFYYLPLIFNQSPPEVITEEECADGSAVAGPMNRTILLSSSTFPNLKVEFGTRKAEYTPEDACVPVSLVLTNIGTEGIILSTEQADELSNLVVGLYTNSRIFKSNFTHISGVPIQSGPFLAPGETSILGTIISRERITLYSVPPLSGGIVRRELNLQGPWGILGLGRIDITVDVDFGDLPDSRVYDPGAGVYFVPGEVIVGFHDDVLLEEAEEFVARHGCHIEDTFFDFVKAFNLSIPFDQTTGEMIAAFMSEPLIVEYADRNMIISVP